VPIKFGKKKIRTLKEAAQLYQAQPAKVQEQQAWQTAWELIARAADDAGWMMFAEMAVVRAASGDASKEAPLKTPAPITSGWQSRRKKRDPWRD
jgi:hypothetical protein